jgi:hypothetical protein
MVRQMRLHRPTRFRLLVVLAATAVGVLGLASGAEADTGPDGFTILYASSGDWVHTCNVISENDQRFQAVVCADLETSEAGSDYYVKAQAEAYCQTTASPHTPAPCEEVKDYARLSTAEGSTADHPASCGDGSCTTARIISATRTWDYTIAGSGNGACLNPDSSYDVWGLVVGDSDITTIITPDNYVWEVGVIGLPPNDGFNESTGHYYVCP